MTDTTKQDQHAELMRLLADLRVGVAEGLHFVQLDEKQVAIEEKFRTLTDRITHLEQVEFAFKEWVDKTEWVQKTARPKELGKHRADVLCERISELEATIETVEGKNLQAARLLIKTTAERDELTGQLEAVGAGGIRALIPAVTQHDAGSVMAQVWDEPRIRALATETAVKVASNACAVEQLCFPHIYLAMKGALLQPADDGVSAIIPMKPTCTGCSGIGEVGGLTSDGYESNTCPYCKGSGVDDSATQTKQIAVRSVLVDLIAEHLSGTYHCKRTWAAWGIGTMSQDDFEDVGESDTPSELVDAILSILAVKPKQIAEPASQFNAGYFYNLVMHALMDVDAQHGGCKYRLQKMAKELSALAFSAPKEQP